MTLNIIHMSKQPPPQHPLLLLSGLSFLSFLRVSFLFLSLILSVLSLAFILFSILLFFYSSSFCCFRCSYSCRFNSRYFYSSSFCILFEFWRAMMIGVKACKNYDKISPFPLPTAYELYFCLQISISLAI